MKKSDGNLRAILRDHLRGGWHWQSIETGAIGGGVPDMNYCCRIPSEGRLMEGTYQPSTGREGWLENKWTDGWAVKFEPEQVAWILRRCRAGGLVTVAVRRRCDAGPRRVRADEIHLFRGTHARIVRDAGLRPFAASAYAASNDATRAALLYRGEGGPARWDWQQIAAALLRRPDPWSDSFDAD